MPVTRMPMKPPISHGRASRATCDSGVWRPMPSSRRSTTSSAPMKTTIDDRWTRLTAGPMYGDDPYTARLSIQAKNGSNTRALLEVLDEVLGGVPLVGDEAAGDQHAEPQRDRGGAGEPRRAGVPRRLRLV